MVRLRVVKINCFENKLCLGDTTSEVAGKYASVSVFLDSAKGEVTKNGATVSLGSDVGIEWWVLEEVQGAYKNGSYKSLPHLSIITFNERVFPQSVSYLAGYGSVHFLTQHSRIFF